MKRLFILFLLLFTTDSFASGIATNAASAPCTNNTLETYSGNSNLAADWQPNEINLSWYNENEKLTVQQSAQSCTYDGTLTVPQTPPTRTGYTFAGWEVIAAVPTEYTRLEYLESTGTQYINTGVKLTSNDIIYEWNAKDNDYNSVETTLFGAQLEAGGPYAGILYMRENHERSSYIGQTMRVYMGYNSNDGAFHSWKWYINSDNTSYLIKDGVKLSTVSWTNPLYKSGTIALYANHYGNSFSQLSSAAFKYFKITDNGNVVFHGIPVRRNSDNVLGIWDMVNKTFLTNQGTGNFVAGPVVQ